LRFYFFTHLELHMSLAFFYSVVATVLGSIPASAGTVKSGRGGRQSSVE
jgi:hypothetical protein